MTDQELPDVSFEALLEYLWSLEEELPEPVLRRPEPPDELEEGDIWRRGDEEVIAWVDTYYEPGVAPWYERRRHQIYPGSVWFGPCLLEGYDPTAPIFFAETPWLQVDGEVTHVTAGFDARDGRLVMLPGTTAHKIWIRRYEQDARTDAEIWALDRARRAHYKETGQATPTQLDELPGALVNQWYVPTQGGSETWPWS